MSANVFAFTTIQTRLESITLLFHFLHAPLASLIIWIWLNYSLPINLVINEMIITLPLQLRSESDICSKHIPDLGVDVNLQLISLTVFLTLAWKVSTLSQSYPFASKVRYFLCSEQSISTKKNKEIRFCWTNHWFVLTYACHMNLWSHLIFPLTSIAFVSTLPCGLISQSKIFLLLFPVACCYMLKTIKSQKKEWVCPSSG